MPPSEQGVLWTNLCCSTADAGMPEGTAVLCWQGLRLKPKSYFQSAVDGAVTAKQTAPDLPAGIPGESSLQTQQLPEATICCGTVSSKSPLPSPCCSTSRNNLSVSHIQNQKAHCVCRSLKMGQEHPTSLHSSDNEADKSNQTRAICVVIFRKRHAGDNYATLLTLCIPPP